MPNTDEIKDTCADSFAAFCMYIQGEHWFDPVHVELCHFVQNEMEKNVVAGHDVELMVVLPRGSLKTTIMTKLLSVWLTIPSKRLTWKGPDFRILIATNTLDNAREKLKGVRGMYDLKAIKRLWPELQAGNPWGNDNAQLKRDKAWEEPTFGAAGTKSQKTGSHWNLILEDDTTAPEKSDLGVDIVAPSRELVEQGIGWHKAAMPLLVPRPAHDPLQGVRMRIVVSTRWADFDLISYLAEKEKFPTFDRPALRPDGTRMFKMMYSTEELDTIKERLGPYMFAALYMNAPLDASQRAFNDEWFQWVNFSEIPEDTVNSIAIDPAISEKDSACETAITKVSHHYDLTKGRRVYQYWTNDIHAHLNPLQTAQKALDLVDDRTKAIIVEVNAYQAALKHILWDEMARRNMHVDIIPHQSRTKKEMRIFAMQPLFAGGRIKLVRGLTPQVESQLKQFPNGRLVDVIDSFAMHSRMYKRERLDPIVEAKPKIDPDSGGAILDSIKKRTTKKGMATGLERNSPVVGSLSTGLGIRSDVNTLFN